jgi:hypothetical protein
VLSEIAPWCAARPDIQIELGNEPNSKDASDDAAWKFRWFLKRRYVAPQSGGPGRSGDWYHFCDQLLDDDQRAYQLPTSAFDELRAGTSA